uniref:Uncharacterized protein n=1 Tax=Monopterus albus TaxID=43700 RepID=A0A3Q3Q3J1_MONAL
MSFYEIFFVKFDLLTLQVGKLSAMQFLHLQSVNTGDKTALIQAKPTNQPSQVKPFAGKVFYLDLPSNRTAEKLESDIKELGGVRQKYI